MAPVDTTSSQSTVVNSSISCHFKFTVIRENVPFVSFCGVVRYTHLNHEVGFRTCFVTPQLAFFWSYTITESSFGLLVMSSRVGPKPHIGLHIADHLGDEYTTSSFGRQHLLLCNDVLACSFDCNACNITGNRLQRSSRNFRIDG